MMQNCDYCEDKCKEAECQWSPCRYPNGPIPLLVAQILIIVSFAMSFYATWDCQFVEVDASLVSGVLDDIERLSKDFDFTGPTTFSNATTRGLGFYFWEGIDGECAPHGTDYSENMYDLYKEVLGSDWNVPRAMANVTTIFAFLLLIWLFLFSCVAQPGEIRYILAFTLLIIMTIFSAIPFMLLNSDFCSENNCSMGRSAKYAAGATSLYFLIGVAFMFTQRYPKPTPTQHPVGFDQKDVEEPPIPIDEKEDFVLEDPDDLTLQDVSLANEYPERVKTDVY
jgi:hypothetical protein